MTASRTKLVKWNDAMIGPRAAKAMSGLEYARAIANGTYIPPICELLGFRLIQASEGKAVFEGRPGEEHYNPGGSVHGGFACTLLDSALGCAVGTKLGLGLNYATVQLNVNLVRPITSTTGMVRAEGTVVRMGRKMATASAELRDSAGRLLAHGTTTCLIV
jgi:uncharacterized protein (TIGR00369 family)